MELVHRYADNGQPWPCCGKAQAAGDHVTTIPGDVTCPGRRRATSLSPQDIHLLRTWGDAIAHAFGGEIPYLVGSVARAEERWRDVDVRLMLPDDELALLTAGNPDRLDALNLAFTLWGRHVTGLPIDFQFQGEADANAEHHGPRNPLFHGARTR